MSVKKLVQSGSPVALALLVASCDTSVKVIEPETGPATGTNTTELSGNVADGYIRGATVCVDVNSNDACDSDEPSQVTGAGGAYTLSIPEGVDVEGKSTIAAIPESAIDEDTGDAVGEAIVFIAPPDDTGSPSGFVSPLTTMIHQELLSNPSLDVEDAETAVKALLGVEGSDISLFDNYVEEKASTGANADR